MFLLYVDASGTPEVPGDRDVFAMIGVCVHEGTWFALEKRVRGLKSRYGLSSPDVELHAKDFCRSILDQERIPGFEGLSWEERRAHIVAARSARLAATPADERSQRAAKDRSTAPFVHLTRLERTRLLEDALDLVGSHDGIRLFGEVIDKPHFFKQTGERSAMRQAFTQVVTRFDHFLKRFNHHAPSGRLENGLLLMDREPTHERYLEQMLHQYRSNGHPWGELRHVLEIPFFVDSRSVPAVQIGDLCAYAVRRYIERAATATVHEVANFRRIWHRFDRSGPRLHGIRHFCGLGSCPCLVCCERGMAAHAPDRVEEHAEAYDVT